MPNAVKWSSPTNFSTGISAATVNDAAGSLGSEYDNETNKHRWMSLELSTTHGGGAPTGAWFVWIVSALDGTAYENGDASTQPGRIPDAVLGMRSTVNAQVVTANHIQIPPFKFKLLLWNDTGFQGTSVTLDAEVYDEEIQ